MSTAIRLRQVPAAAGKPSSATADADALAVDLRRAIRGEVRFDAGSRALYATDASNYRQPPIGVVLPHDADDVESALAVCRKHAAPVFGRGGGTSLAGQCCNAAVCFDMSKYMNGVLDVDERQRLGRVQPGAVLDDLRHRASQYGLTFGPDPATHNHCTLGGMVGNDSCGVHSVLAQFSGRGARTADNIEELEVVTYDGARMRVGHTSPDELERIIARGGRQGDIYRRLRALRDRHADAIRRGFAKIPRRVSGYNLPQLLPENGFNVARALVGTEGTCVMLLEVVANLIPNPPERSLVVLGYPSVYDAGDDIPAILEFQPTGLEGMDDRLVEDMRATGIHTKHLGLLPEGRGWLLVEFGGESREQAEDKAREMMDALQRRRHPPACAHFTEATHQEEIWRIRESGLGATAHASQTHPTWPGWEDSAVPPDKVGVYLRQLRQLLDDHGYGCDLYGHFGQGCIHTRIDFDLETADGVRRYRSFLEKAADLVVALGGSLSGEHGDGQARGELLSRMFGPELIGAFHEFKEIWDPHWKMNPGKVIEPARLDEHLRLGSTYNPPQVHTHFQFPNDRGSFSKAALRCVGVGECRRHDGGTMCPSYMVTHEEMHSTRGRARLLFEMLQGDPLTGGWQDEHVKEALDLCLACKGCKGDCPVHVDMATYKAEFLSHYYQRHRRPLTAYAFGLIRYWARAGAAMPLLANTVMRTPVIDDLIKRVIGIAPAREVPAFAPYTFTRWFARRQAPPRRSGPTVLLWPDTFNNHFHPETAIAAVRVLERAGANVEIPPRPLCCGRPLFDYGMLDSAKRWLREVMDTLEPSLAAGVPVVGLEPSCVAVFRDEVRELFPNLQSAKRLATQTLTLAEFLNRQQFRFPRLERRAVVHGHCHHKAIMKMSADERALQRMGLQYQLLDSGCCGLAGSFGYENDHYDVSIAAGERVLLPAVRAIGADTLVIADGFSCRSQIAQNTDRRALHLAEVIDMAEREGPLGPTGDHPEQGYVIDHGRSAASLGKATLVVTLLAVGGVLLGAFARSRRSLKVRGDTREESSQ